MTITPGSKVALFFAIQILGEIGSEIIYPNPAYPGYGYGYPGSAYGYGYSGYALVPVLVAVPQRQVVRETVTEEWVDEPVRSRSVPRHHHAAPRADKRIKLIKGR